LSYHHKSIILQKLYDTTTLSSISAMSKIFIGLSGGVDSSVAAALLQQQMRAEHSFELEAVFMQNWRGQEESCTIKDDYADAQKIAVQLGIKLHFVDFSERYWQDVFEYFLSEIEAGRTPNPDILCNQHVKFDAFLEWAKAHGGTGIATGHYAQISNGCLTQAVDRSKDQSYFLWAVAPEKLQQCLFPVGSWHKTAVRSWALDNNLMTHSKKDSVGICFVGPKNFQYFLKQYLCTQPGLILTEDSVIIGQHQGAIFYTLGQRSGLHIGGQKGLSQLPWYVIAKDIVSNTITVAQDENHPLLLSHELTASKVVWHGAIPSKPTPVLARFRHLQPLQEAVLEVLSESQIKVHFKQAQRSINAGQAVVVYDGLSCLVGGWID
jgi:tRNA-specific 2-thiouridylase